LNATPFPDQHPKEFPFRLSCVGSGFYPNVRSLASGPSRWDRCDPLSTGLPGTLLSLLSSLKRELWALVRYFVVLPLELIEGVLPVSPLVAFFGRGYAVSAIKVIMTFFGTHFSRFLPGTVCAFPPPPPTRLNLSFSFPFSPSRSPLDICRRFRPPFFFFSVDREAPPYLGGICKERPLEPDLLDYLKVPRTSNRFPKI